MPIFKEPLIVNCFKCKKKILVKFVPFRKAYSQKNNWGYWTEKEENKKKSICCSCLKKLYLDKKRKFLSLISSLKKRQALRNYISDKII